MNSTDRLINLCLFGLAIVAWAGTAYVLLSFDPRNNSSVLLAGALLLGSATALTVAPLFWLSGFVLTRRIAYRGDWWRATRRSLLVGVVVSTFVILRGQAALTPQLALFILVMAVLVEVTLSLRR